MTIFLSQTRQKGIPCIPIDPFIIFKELLPNNLHNLLLSREKKGILFLIQSIQNHGSSEYPSLSKVYQSSPEHL